MNQYQKITKEYNRTIVIGDIHGCYAELMQLLIEIKFSDNDLLIAVGDLVDRGPASWEVATFFKNTKNAYSVLGNHERRIAGVIRGTSTSAWSQSHSLSKISIDERLLWAEYFESLPAVIETPHAIITHARLDHGKQIFEQEPKFTCAVGGYAIVIEKDQNDAPLWFYEWEKKHGISKPICMGHLGYERIELVPQKLFALDTGGVKGNFLTAVILPENKIVQIKSSKNYYAESKLEWSSIELSELSPELLPIHKYYSFIEKEVKNTYEKQAIAEFEKCLNNLKIDSIVEKISQKFLIVFGELPISGIEKGRYFQNVREKLPGENHRLVNMILSAKPFNIDYFLKLFLGSTIENALIELEKIEHKIKNV